MVIRKQHPPQAEVEQPSRDHPPSLCLCPQAAPGATGLRPRREPWPFPPPPRSPSPPVAALLSSHRSARRTPESAAPPPPRFFFLSLLWVLACLEPGEVPRRRERRESRFLPRHARTGASLGAQHPRCPPGDRSCTGRHVTEESPQHPRRLQKGPRALAQARSRSSQPAATRDGSGKALRPVGSRLATPEKSAAGTAAWLALGSTPGPGGARLDRVQIPADFIQSDPRPQPVLPAPRGVLACPASAPLPQRPGPRNAPGRMGSAPAAAS